MINILTQTEVESYFQRYNDPIQINIDQTTCTL